MQGLIVQQVHVQVTTVYSAESPLKGAAAVQVTTVYYAESPLKGAAAAAAEQQITGTAHTFIGTERHTNGG